MNVTQSSIASRQNRKNKSRSEPEGSLFTIGEVAHEFAVSLRTLRFYEDRGLLHPIRRGTARSYSEEQRDLLRLIIQGKGYGFSLTDIKQMLGKRNKSSQSNTLTMSVEEISNQIVFLERQKADVTKAIDYLRASLDNKTSLVKPAV